MKQKNYLAKNLRTYMETRKLTMKEFADVLDIPLSTLRTVMREGNTTLHTAIQISRSLGVSLDILINDSNFPDKLFFMIHIQNTASWFAALSDENKNKFAGLINEMWTTLVSVEISDDAK